MVSLSPLFEFVFETIHPTGSDIVFGGAAIALCFIPALWATLG